MTFPVPPDPSSAQPSFPLAPLHMQAQQQLEKLVQLTKQERKMNVLLVSSEYAYPFRLRHGRFFNTTNLADTLFAGEVPPAKPAAAQMGSGATPHGCLPRLFWGTCAHGFPCLGQIDGGTRPVRLR